MDTAGPLKTKSRHNQHVYFTVTVDQYSKYSWVFSHTQRTSAENIKFLDLVRAELRGVDATLETLLTDNAPEFVSAEHEAYCTMHNIKRIYSNEYQQYQNSMAERRIGILKNMTRVSLDFAGMAKFYWFDVLKYMNYLYNYLPCSSNAGDAIPAELFDPENFHVDRYKHIEAPIGAYGIAHRGKDLAQDRALDPRGVEGIFLGRGETLLGKSHYGDLIYNATTRRLYCTTDTKFDPTYFPLRPYGERRWANGEFTGPDTGAHPESTHGNPFDDVPESYDQAQVQGGNPDESETEDEPMLPFKGILKDNDEDEPIQQTQILLPSKFPEKFQTWKPADQRDYLKGYEGRRAVRPLEDGKSWEVAEIQNFDPAEGLFKVKYPDSNRPDESWTLEYTAKQTSNKPSDSMPWSENLNNEQAVAFEDWNADAELDPTPQTPKQQDSQTSSEPLITPGGSIYFDEFIEPQESRNESSTTKQDETNTTSSENEAAILHEMQELGGVAIKGMTYGKTSVAYTALDPKYPRSNPLDSDPICALSLADEPGSTSPSSSEMQS